MRQKNPEDTPRRPGRPAGGQERMSFTLDPALLPYMQAQAAAAGYVVRRSGKPNVSGWLNAVLTAMREANGE